MKIGEKAAFSVGIVIAILSAASVRAAAREHAIVKISPQRRCAAFISAVPYLDPHDYVLSFDDVDTVKLPKHIAFGQAGGIES